MLLTLKKCQSASDYHQFWTAMALLVEAWVIIGLELAGLRGVSLILGSSMALPTIFLYEPLRRLVQIKECQADLRPAQELLEEISAGRVNPGQSQPWRSR